MTRAPEPRPGLRDVDAYVSPQIPVDVRLNTNECPHPLPEEFARDLAGAVADLPLHRYPDGQMTRLREDLAAHTGHPVEGTWPANGANEVIAQLLAAYGGPGRCAAMFEPTYLLHSRIAWITNTEVAQRRLDPPFTIDDAAIAWAAQTAPDVVFVCSPNNPTGNAQTLDTIRTLADAVDALVIVDEAYIDFGGETALPLTTDHPNLVVLRTLSKAFALAGARLGYCLAAPQVIEDLQRIRLPYHLGALTQAAGIAALRHTAAAEAIVDAMREQRDRLLKELGAIEGLAVHPSEANFVLFVPRAPAADVWQGLLDRGVLIRDLSAVVPNALRVSAGTEHEITRFLDALQEVLA